MSTREIHENPAGVAPMTRWRKMKLVFKVVELRLRFIALMAATGLVFGYWDTIWNYYEKWTRPAHEIARAVSGFEFYCPMHPSVVRDEPGICPICGMPLSKRKKGEAEAWAEGVTSRVRLGPMRVAQAGVRTVGVSYQPLEETLTTVGVVAFDERRLARIASKTKGMTRVERLLVNFTGTEVKAGEPLAEVYSPELYQAMQELVAAGRRAKAAPRASPPYAGSLLGDPAELVRLGREKLILWGVTSAQVDAILASGKAETRTQVLAPIGGTVVRKDVVEGQYVAEGETMFEIADLTHVWVLAQVYEDRFASVHVGQPVEATVEAYPGEVFQGEVAFVDPVLDPSTRTVNVRYDLGNEDRRLRPGMFATVTLRSRVADMPAFAALRGKAKADGAVVTAAADQQICPVTRLKLGVMGKPVEVDVDGRKVLTCCGDCEAKLKASPAKYLARLNPAPDDAVLSVPESAVIDTGIRKIVYVEAEPGVFEGREVVLGARSGDRYPVLKGLSPGETIADAGAFLIDAETRLNPAAGAAAPTPAHDHKPAPEPPPRAASAVISDDVTRR